MKQDEFAFFNRQLAVMLRTGIPLEGALKQLCQGMSRGALRAEVEQLEADLERGTPLTEALGRRKLPEFYARMVEIGARANDLPGVLTLLADHYERSNALFTRLKGLLVYPVLVVLVSLGLTFLLSMSFSRFMGNFFDLVTPAPVLLAASVWAPPIFLLLVALVAAVAAYQPAWRARLRWRLPAFREASLAQFASAVALMLRNGATLPDALALAEKLESATPARKALQEWQTLVRAGKGKPSQWPATRPFPPLFLWLLQNGGEDVASGFQKAAEIYQNRASFRIELALYGALPVSILVLGQMVFWQAAPTFRVLVWMMNMLGDNGGVRD
jgi:type II secretory pathway component PulF